MPARRAMVLGLDGVSWNVYRSLRGHGYLASLGKLEPKTVKGSVDMIPPLTPPMWTSITSGVNPGKHGIYQFSLTTPWGKVVRLHNALDVMHPRIHDIVSYNGLQSLVVNLPLSSWPLVPFRGALIADWLSPRDYARPEWLNEIYQRRLKEHAEEAGKDGPCRHVARDAAIMETLLEAEKKGLLEETRYVFIMLEFLDALLHRYPDEAYNPREPCLREALGLLDDLVDSLLPYAADEGLFMVLSDHGNDRSMYRVSVPRILYDRGLVKPAFVAIKESAIKKSDASQQKPLIVRIANMAMKSRVLGPLATRLGRAALRLFPGLRAAAMHVERPIVDEDNSPVVVPREWSYGIFVNTRIVPEHEVEKYIEAVIGALHSFEKETGHRFSHTIARGRGGLYHGPYVDRAPHVVVAPRQGYSLAAANLYAAPIEKSNGLGSHHPQNIHMVLAPSDEPELETMARELREPWDYATLILAAMGLSLPHDTDSTLCKRARARCPLRNYNTRYALARRVAERTLSLTRSKTEPR